MKTYPKGDPLPPLPPGSTRSRRLPVLKECCDMADIMRLSVWNSLLALPRRLGLGLGLGLRFFTTFAKLKNLGSSNESTVHFWYTIHPMKYMHGSVEFFRLWLYSVFNVQFDWITLILKGELYYCPSAIEVTLKDMGKIGQYQNKT